MQILTYEQFCNQILFCYTEIVNTELSIADFEDVRHAAVERASAGGDISVQIVTDIFALIYNEKYT